MTRGKGAGVGPGFARRIRWDLIDIEGLLHGDHRGPDVGAFVEGLENLEPLIWVDRVAGRRSWPGRPSLRLFLRCGLYGELGGGWASGSVSWTGLWAFFERDAAYRWLLRRGRGW